MHDLFVIGNYLRGYRRFEIPDKQRKNDIVANAENLSEKGIIFR